MPELSSYILALGLGIAVIVCMAAAFNIVRENAQQSFAQAMAENTCHQLKLAAEQLEPSSHPASIELALPIRIGGEPYSIRANDHTFIVASPHASHGCIAGTAAQLSGSASGGPVQLVLSENVLMLSGV